LNVVLVVAAIIVFLAGFVLACQGIIGKEIRSEGAVFGRLYHADSHGPVHPPDQHRLRLFIIGAGLMVLAVVLVLIFG
jgi:hypothetical protein